MLIAGSAIVARANSINVCTASLARLIVWPASNLVRLIATLLAAPICACLGECATAWHDRDSVRTGRPWLGVAMRVQLVAHICSISASTFGGRQQRVTVRAIDCAYVPIACP